MRAHHRFLLALLVAAAAVIVSLSPAQALSCINPTGVYADADRAFTGTIIDADRAGTPDREPGGSRTRILVDVAEVWKGGPVHDRVWLETELDGWWDMLDGSTFPVGYSSPTTWLFAPRAGKDGAPTVNPCSAWDNPEPWGHRLRPSLTTLSVEDQAAATDGAGPSATSTTKTVRSSTTSADQGTSRAILAGVGAGLAGFLVAIGVRSRRRTG